MELPEAPAAAPQLPSAPPAPHEATTWPAAADALPPAVLSWPPHARVSEPRALPRPEAFESAPPAAPRPATAPPSLLFLLGDASEAEDSGDATLRDGGGDDAMLAEASARRDGEAAGGAAECIVGGFASSASTSPRSGMDSARGVRCRICLDGVSGAEFESGEGIRLGCDCRGEVGVVHTVCAERWFARKGKHTRYCAALGDLQCEVCAAAVPNVRLLAPPPGSRAANAAAARRAAAMMAQRSAARRAAFSRRGASSHAGSDRIIYATRAQLAAVDTAAKQLFPLSLATGAAASCYYILAMGVGTVVGVALGALISTTYCALACQEVICHSYDSRLLVPWLVFLALTTVGWSFALAELFAAFAFSGDATLAATAGAVLASVATAVNFKQRKMCAVAVALCCCRRRAATQAVEVPLATPQEAPAPAEATPLAPPAAAQDATAQLPV